MAIVHCPFCGILKGVHAMIVRAGVATKRRVVCGTCGGGGPYGDDEKQAWELWNRRDVFLEKEKE